MLIRVPRRGGSTAQPRAAQHSSEQAARLAASLPAVPLTGASPERTAPSPAPSWLLTLLQGAAISVIETDCNVRSVPPVLY